MGGGSPSNTTATTTNQLDPAVRQMTLGNYAAAQGVANQKYDPYSGQMIAPLNSLQTQGINQGAGAAAAGAGMGAINLGITNAATAGGYNPSQVSMPGRAPQVSAPGAYNPLQVGSGMWDTGAAQQYMNPYTQQVINAANTNIDRSLAQTQNATNAEATTAGAYGGTRQAVANAENARNADQLKAQTSAGLLSDAYTNAQNAFQADQGRSLAAQQSNQQAGLSAGLTAGQQALAAQEANQQAGLAGQQMGLSAQQANQQAGLSAANLGLGSADLLGRLGISQQGVAQNNAQALYGYGAIGQDLQNQQNQWDYQNNYLNPQQWPLRGLSALESAVSGIPYSNSSATTQPLYKNKTAGALGGAASGAAMGSSFGPWGTAIGGVAGGLLGYFG